MQPRVSIIMPVFNGGGYFERAVESALAQTYPHIEILLVNDGSTDGGQTDAACRRFAAAHPEIVRYISQENTGVSGALNAGIAAATGDIFCWLSHDDLFEPEKTTRQVDFYLRLGGGDAILISDYRLIDPEGAVLHEIRLPHALAAASPRLPLYKGWINGCTIFAPIKLLGPEPFDLRYRHVQDYRLWLRLVEDHEFYHQPELLVRYRVHPGQDSNKLLAVEEGDKLWAEMIESCRPAVRAQLSGSSWRFFEDARLHLQDTPYERAMMQATALRDAAIPASLVSVVIPVFNEEAVALRAMRSVQAQTHANLEIILVDDGSTVPLDDLREAVRLEPRARLLRQENAGPGAARNRGIREARGEYIAFLDSDDVFLSEKIERQVEAMQRAGGLISHTSYYVTYPERRADVGLLRSGALSGRVYPAILSGCSIATPTVMIHRLLVAEGFSFSENIRLGEDVLTWIDSVVRHPLLGLDDPLSVVEWSSSSAALDLDKGLQGAKHQLAALSRNPMHASKPELSRLHDFVDSLTAGHSQLAEGAGLKDDFVFAAFRSGETIDQPILQPQPDYRLEAFLEAKRPDPHIDVRNSLSTLTRAADLARERGWAPVDLDLDAPENDVKFPQDARPGAVAFTVGSEPWAYVGAVSIRVGRAKGVEVVLKARERVYLLLVDDRYEQVGKREVVEPGGQRSCWFEIEAEATAHAVVVQASEAPGNQQVVLARATAYIEYGASVSFPK